MARVRIPRPSYLTVSSLILTKFHLLTTAHNSADGTDNLFSCLTLNNSCPSASLEDDGAVLDNESDTGTGIVHSSAE